VARGFIERARATVGATRLLKRLNMGDKTELQVVVITKEMEKAGLEALFESSLADLKDLVSNVYLMMEYRRQHDLNKTSGSAE
jgi:GTPase